jgi:CheY-like chemotaxis protein
LVVDDEEDLAYLMKAGLELSGLYDVDTFNDSQEALNEFKANKYDLVLIDILMPSINGFDFYKLIKEKDPNFLGSALYPPLNTRKRK